jgi:copper chaperone
MLCRNIEPTRACSREEMMDRLTMKIDGMSCGHCVSQVQKALQALDGVDVQQVTVGSATVGYNPVTTPEAQITQAIEHQGYRVASIAH